MRYGKTTVYLFTLLFGALAVILWALEPRTETRPVDLILSSTGEERTVTSWRNEAGEYYLFLPGHGDLASAHLRVHAPDARIDGRPAEDGMSCGEFTLDQPYSFSFDSPEGQVSTVLTFVQSENLPTVYVDTGSGSMDYIHGKKGNQEAGRMSLYLPDGTLAYIGNLDGINGRGNTWIIPKKSYSLQLAAEADLLGMGQAEKWILLSNAFDGSHLRNKLVCDFADALGLAFSPESRWVDLYLNGEYAGLYLLCEKNEIHPQRVDIGEEDGVLISIEKEDRLWEYGSSQFITDHGIPIRIRQTGMEMPLLQEKLRCAENAILAPDGVDPVSGKHYTELIDVQSWAKKYLIEEIFGNLDAGSISQFFYWEGNGKIFAGPVWDYDITMGNPHNWQLESPRMLFAGRPNLWNPEDTPWLYALYQKDAFRQAVMDSYETEFRPVLQELLHSGLNQYETEIRDAAALDRMRWSTESAPDTVEAMKAYMMERMDFLDSLWLEKKDFHLISVYIQEHVMACYAVENGACFPEMPVPYGTETIIYEAWYDGDTDQPFDFAVPITGDKLIYLKETNLLAGDSIREGISLRQLITYVPFAVMLMLMLTMLIKEKYMHERRADHSHDQPKISP